MTDSLEYVEIMFDEDLVDKFIAQSGVKGMKWGIRKSKKKTGLSRAEGSAIDRNNRRIARIQNGKRQNEMTDLRITAMKMQNARIKEGRRIAEDNLEIRGGTSLYGLFISRAPAEAAA